MDNIETHTWRHQFERLEGAYSPSTMRGYYADVEHYTKYCSTKGINPFPTSVSDLCNYMDFAAQGSASATVRRRIYSIRKIHQLMSFPDPTRDENVNLCLRRIRRSKLERPRQALGLNKSMLNLLIDSQPKTPWGLRNAAMLSIGYDLLNRRSELVALNTSDVHFEPSGSARIIIRRSKSDQYGSGRVAFTSRRSVDLLRSWLDWRGPEIEPLFCGIYRAKPLNRSLEASFVKRLIKQSAKRAGLPEMTIATLSGHSLRVGAAQDLLTMGHDTSAIMRAGGWKSVNILARYLEYSNYNVWENSTASNN